MIGPDDITADDIRVDAKGRYYIYRYLGTDQLTRRPIRPYHTLEGASSESEAVAEARKWLEELPEAVGIFSTKTLSEMLGWYVGIIEANGYSPTTVVTYESLRRSCIDGTVGSLPAAKINPPTFDGLFKALQVDGGSSGKPLSLSSIRKLYYFLRGAYNLFVREGLVQVNPLLAVEKPRLVKHEAVALMEDDYMTLSAALEAAMEDDSADAPAARRRTVCFAAYLALNTGMRCSEICGLDRRDVHIARKEIHVGHAMKEGKSGLVRLAPKRSAVRNVAIGDDVLATALSHEAWQESFLGAGSGRSPLVTVDGSWMHPKRVSEEFSDMRDRLGIDESVTFHSLRHTHATYLLANGVDLREIQHRLGHAKPSMTLDIYSHVLPGRDRAAAEAMQRMNESGMML